MNQDTALAAADAVKTLVIGLGLTEAVTNAAPMVDAAKITGRQTLVIPGELTMGGDITTRGRVAKQVTVMVDVMERIATAADLLADRALLETVADGLMRAVLDGVGMITAVELAPNGDRSAFVRNRLFVAELTLTVKVLT